MDYQPSIRGKITLGLYFFGAVMIILASFMFLEVRYLEQRFLRGEAVFRFFENAQEIRRYEKNYFLYRQERDYQENAGHLAQAKTILAENRGLFLGLLGRESFEHLTGMLTTYALLMNRYSAQHEQADLNEDERLRVEDDIRAVGKAVSVLTENLTRDERRLLHQSITSSIHIFVIAMIILAVVTIVTGQILSRRITGSLKKLENTLARVAEGNFSPIEAGKGEEREIRSLERAFNRMLRELDLHQKRLVQSEKLVSLGTMLSGVAHELNNPISNISTSCQILVEEFEGLDAGHRRQLLEAIDDQTQRARNILRTLLDFSREQHGKHTTVRLKSLVEESMWLMRSHIPSRVAVSTSIPDEVMVRANKQKLQQVLVNLVNNSLDAMGGEGRIDITAELSPQAATAAQGADGAPAQQSVLIRISDTGSGIDPENLPRIFDPFYTSKDVGEGAGLGLFIVYEIIQEHDGTISVDSEPGNGTTFTIRLPLADDRPVA